MWAEEFDRLYNNGEQPVNEMFEIFLKTCENTKNEEFLMLMLPFTKKPGLLKKIGKQIKDT